MWQRADVHRSNGMLTSAEVAVCAQSTWYEEWFLQETALGFSKETAVGAKHQVALCIGYTNRRVAWGQTRGAFSVLFFG